MDTVGNVQLSQVAALGCTMQQVQTLHSYIVLLCVPNFRFFLQLLSHSFFLLLLISDYVFSMHYRVPI